MLPSSPAYRGASTTISSPDNEAAAFARSGADHGSHQRGNADSAIRWRRNGAGGLGIVVCLRLFRAGFSRSAVFAIRRLALFAVVFLEIVFCNLQCCASRSLPARKLAASAVAGLAAPQATFASFRKSVRCKFASSASVGAVLFSCRSPRGEFCEPPQGGASARTAEAGVYLCKLRLSRTSFPSPFRVAASCILQSAAEFANNSVVCHSEEIGRSTKNLYQMFRFAQHDVAASMPHIAAISLVRKSRCQGCRPCARGRLALKARPLQPARAST